MRWADAPTQRIAVAGHSFAYRELGVGSGVPVVCPPHFTAVLGDWDPRVLDGLAARRRIVVFARSALTRRHPKHAGFFTRTPDSRRAATACHARLAERTGDRVPAGTLLAAIAQLRAIVAYRNAAPHDLSQIRQPTLVANGDDDVMVATRYSHDLAARRHDSRLRSSPASGHGGVVQHHRDFLPETLDVVGAGDGPPTHVTDTHHMDTTPNSPEAAPECIDGTAVGAGPATGPHEAVATSKGDR